jgi:hypothetical protein
VIRSKELLSARSHWLDRLTSLGNFPSPFSRLILFDGCGFTWKCDALKTTGPQDQQLRVSCGMPVRLVIS